MAEDKKTRGEQRFGGVTYSQIAEWSGLKLSTIQAYGARRRGFDPHNLESVLQWVNARRQARGLPMIGAPEEEPETDIAKEEPVTMHPLLSPYNPLTGEIEL